MTDLALHAVDHLLKSGLAVPSMRPPAQSFSSYLRSQPPVQMSNIINLTTPEGRAEFRKTSPTLSALIYSATMRNKNVLAEQQSLRDAFDNYKTDGYELDIRTSPRIRSRLASPDLKELVGPMPKGNIYYITDDAKFIPQEAPRPAIIPPTPKPKVRNAPAPSMTGDSAPRPRVMRNVNSPVGIVKKSSDKQASPRWIKMLRGGGLSSSGLNRIAKTMPEGSFRTVNHIGHGSMNIADRVVGNVAGNAGEMVRKLPINPNINLQSYYKPLVDASRQIESVAPGVHARYLAATPRGAFQQLAGKQNLIPRGGTAEGWQQSVRQKLEPLGFSDMHKDNFTPGGMLFDFQAGRFGGAAAGGQMFNQKAIMNASPQFRSAINAATTAPPAQRNDAFGRALSMVPKLPYQFYDAQSRVLPGMRIR